LRWALQRWRLRALPRTQRRQIAHIVVRVIDAFNGGRGHGRGYCGGRRLVSITFVSVGSCARCRRPLS
jgi:hypothetical protein